MSTPTSAKRLVVTSDDFGLSLQVNEAVERAHRDGAGRRPAGSARPRPSRGGGRSAATARRAPGPPHRRHRARSLARNPRARRQLAAEIRAQFEAFRATGLPLDHVNAHKHFGEVGQVGGRQGRPGLDHHEVEADPQRRHGARPGHRRRRRADAGRPGDARARPRPQSARAPPARRRDPGVSRDSRGTRIARMP
jgi:hypothetical protein